MEEWKDIVGYEGLYQVSNMGRVKSLERTVIRGRGGLCKIEEKILKSYKTINGYLTVNLCKEGKMKTHTVHRLIAQSFLPNPDNLPEINHKDENKTNNCVNNLEWCSAKYNTNYGTRNKRIEKPILQFSKTGEFIRKWESGTQVERELGIDNSSISNCLKGRSKTAYGYKWGYADDYKKIKFNVFELEIYKKIA